MLNLLLKCLSVSEIMLRLYIYIYIYIYVCVCVCECEYVAFFTDFSWLVHVLTASVV